MSPFPPPPPPLPPGNSALTISINGKELTPRKENRTIPQLEVRPGELNNLKKTVAITLGVLKTYSEILSQLFISELINKQFDTASVAIVRAYSDDWKKFLADYNLPLYTKNNNTSFYLEQLPPDKLSNRISTALDHSSQEELKNIAQKNESVVIEAVIEKPDDLTLYDNCLSALLAFNPALKVDVTGVTFSKNKKKTLMDSIAGLMEVSNRTDSNYRHLLAPTTALDQSAFMLKKLRHIKEDLMIYHMQPELYKEIIETIEKYRNQSPPPFWLPYFPEPDEKEKTIPTYKPGHVTLIIHHPEGDRQITSSFHVKKTENAVVLTDPELQQQIERSLAGLEAAEVSAHASINELEDIYAVWHAMQVIISINHAINFFFDNLNWFVSGDNQDLDLINKCAKLCLKLQKQAAISYQLAIKNSDKLTDQGQHNGNTPLESSKSTLLSKVTTEGSTDPESYDTNKISLYGELSNLLPPPAFPPPVTRKTISKK